MSGDDNDKMDVNNSFVSDVINKVSIGTSNQSLNNVMLQSAVVMLDNNSELEFLLDGGAVASIISLHAVKKLGKESDIHPTNKSLKFAVGDIDIPCGVVKLRLRFSEDIVITHTFCVTDNIHTPLILGMDFMYGANALANPLKQTLTFYRDNQEYVVNTNANSGVVNSDNALDPMIIPVSMTRNKVNKNVSDITIGYECYFTPGDAQLLWVKLNESTYSWNEDKALQHSSILFSKLGLYLVPTVFKKEKGDDPHCIILVNMMQKIITLKKDT